MFGTWFWKSKSRVLACAWLPARTSHCVPRRPPKQSCHFALSPPTQAIPVNTGLTRKTLISSSTTFQRLFLNTANHIQTKSQNSDPGRLAPDPVTSALWCLRHLTLATHRQNFVDARYFHSLRHVTFLYFLNLFSLYPLNFLLEIRLGKLL